MSFASLPNTSLVALDPSALISNAAWTLEGSGPSVEKTAVLHIINGEHFSGAERVQQLLGKGLPEFGYQPSFACLKPGKFPALSGLPTDQVDVTPMRGRFDLSVVKRLVQLANSRSVALLHAHTPRTAMVTSLVAYRGRLPWVYHVHSPTSRDSTRGLVNRLNLWVERLAIRNCDRLITVSQSLAAEMRRLGVPDERLTVVPNGVPDIAPIDSQARLGCNEWRLGMVALMRPRKGVEVALEAMHQLKSHASERDARVSLELIGGFETDDYQRQILGMIEQLGLGDCVQWTGFTNDVPAAIRRLDGLVLPSLFGEGMPMVVLEALAAAVPVVATRVEGTPEVIRDGIEGYLADPRSASSLASSLERLISSRSTWACLSDRALRRHRQHYSAHRMSQGVSQAYDKTIGR